VTGRRASVNACVGAGGGPAASGAWHTDGRCGGAGRASGTRRLAGPEWAAGLGWVVAPENMVNNYIARYPKY